MAVPLPSKIDISSIIDQLPDQLQKEFKTFIYDYWIYLFRKCGIVGFRNTNIKSAGDVTFLNQMSRLLCLNFGCVCIAVAEKGSSKSTSKETLFIFGKRWSNKMFLELTVDEEKLDSDLSIKLTFEVNWNPIQSNPLNQIKSNPLIDAIDIVIRKNKFTKLTSDILIIDVANRYVSFDIENFIDFEEDVIAFSRSHLLLSIDQTDKKLRMQPNCLFWQTHPHKEEIKDWHYSDKFVLKSWNSILSHINSIKGLHRKFHQQFNSQRRDEILSDVNRWFAELKSIYHLNVWCILQDPKQLLLQSISSIEMKNKYNDIVLTLITLYLHYCYLSWCIFQLAIHQSMCNFYPFIPSEFRKVTINDPSAKLKFLIFCYSLIYRYSQQFFYSCCSAIYARLTQTDGLLAFLDKSFEKPTSLSSVGFIKLPAITKALQRFITDSLVNLADATSTFYHIVNNGTGLQLSEPKQSTLDFYENEEYHTEIGLIRYVSSMELKLTKIGCSHLSCPQCYIALDAYRTKISPNLNPVSSHAFLFNWKMSHTHLRFCTELLFGKFALKVLHDNTDVNITLSKSVTGKKRKHIVYNKFKEVCYIAIERMPWVLRYIENNKSVIIKVPKSLSNKWLDIKDDESSSTEYVYIRTVKSKTDINAIMPLSPKLELESADIAINYELLTPQSIHSDYSDDQILEVDSEEESADVQQKEKDSIADKEEEELAIDVTSTMLYQGYKLKQPKQYSRSTIVCDVDKSLYMFIYHFTKNLVDQKFSDIQSLNIDEVMGLLTKIQLHV